MVGYSSIPYSVVVQQQRLEPLQEGEPVQLPDLIVGEVDRVELVKRGSEVFQDRDLIPCDKNRY